MLERKPPRRDPRILVITPTTTGIEYAALDAWEIVGLGVVPIDDARAAVLGVRRLIVKTRPTVVVSAAPRTRVAKLARVLRIVAAAARHAGLPMVELAAGRVRELERSAPGSRFIAKQYPELRAFGTGVGAGAVRLAAAALSSLTFPPRSYATSNPPRPRSAVAAGAPRRARRARRSRDASDRRARGPRHRRGRIAPRAPRP